jgi:hypothetical protein
MLRRATVEDAPAIGRVTAAGFDGYREFAPEGWEPPGDMIGGLGERLVRPGAWGVVEDRDGEICGFAVFIPGHSGGAAVRRRRSAARPRVLRARGLARGLSTRLRRGAGPQRDRDAD